MGITLLRTLILSFHLSQHRSDEQELEPVLQQLWRSSLTQAVLAELIAEQVDSLDAPTCFLAALLQDIGILAMVSEAPADYIDNVLVREEFPDVVSAERSHFGFSHAEVSVEIIKQWGLEKSFVNAVRHHHDQVVATNNNGNSFGKLQTVLQAANLGTAVLFSNRSSARFLGNHLQEWIGFLRIQFGISEVQAEELISEVNQLVASYSKIFNFNIGRGIQTDLVVIKAKELLQEIALNNQLQQIAGKSRVLRGKMETNELYRDSLSGLYNRRFMNEHLNDQMAGCIKKKKPLALMFLDVDKFKLINDNYGHAAGDKAIEHLAKWLNHSIRKNDIAIRLGGDEFLVVLQLVGEQEFEKIARRIADDIPALELENGQTIDISLSIGCVFYQPVKGDLADANWLIDQADQSMYRVKRDGGRSILLQKFVGANLESTPSLVENN